ncbi:hypothetical protein [Natronococcus sp.]|uniref:hypothetical protein n=1 Tax=Natronococcus sp. TaxID=35747 RepID=UPI003A4E0211
MGLGTTGPVGANPRGNGHGREASNNPGRLPRYDGADTRVPPDIGGQEFALMYYAEGVLTGPNPSGGFGFGEFDSPAEHFHLGVMDRSIDQALDDRRDAHEHYREYWGIDFDAGLDNEEVTEETLFQVHDGYNANGVKIAEEVPTQLHPEVGYSNYWISGYGMPNNWEPETNTTNRDPRVTNKVRDGGWWVDVDLNGDGYDDGFAEAEEGAVGNLVGEPTFWYNDKLSLEDTPGLDQAIHDGYPAGETDLFWGNYSIKLGDQETPLDEIHYESRFPTELGARSGIPRAFICELEFARKDGRNVRDLRQNERHRQQLRNELTLGRVHGTVYPDGRLPEGHPLEDDAGEYPVRTLRNVLTFPPSRNRADGGVVPGVGADDMSLGQ